MPTRVPSAWYRFGFYLRFALAGWASLAAFPLLAVLVAPDLLGGLLVLTPVQCGVLGFVVGLALESFGSMVRFIAAYAHRQFDLVYADRDSYRGVELQTTRRNGFADGVAIRAAQLGPAIVLFGAVVFATGQDVDERLPGDRPDSNARLLPRRLLWRAGLHPAYRKTELVTLTDAVYRMTRRARVAAEDVLEQQAFARRQAKLVFALGRVDMAGLAAGGRRFLSRPMAATTGAGRAHALATVPELGQNDHFFRVAEDPKPQDHRLPWDIVCPDGRPSRFAASAEFRRACGPQGSYGTSPMTSQAFANVSD